MSESNYKQPQQSLHWLMAAVEDTLQGRAGAGNEFIFTADHEEVTYLKYPHVAEWEESKQCCVYGYIQQT